MGVFPAAAHLAPQGYSDATTERVWAAGCELGSFRRENLVGGISCRMQRQQMRRREIQPGMRWSARAGGAPAP